MKEKCIISVIGSHAGESIENIFTRKIKDIKDFGETYWLINSYLSRPLDVQNNTDGNMFVYFIEPTVKNGSIPTKTSNCATYISTDGVKWIKINPEISPVTGKFNKGTTGLFLKDITICDSIIDLSEFSDINNDVVKFKLGCSTILSFPNQKNGPDKIRKVVAIGKLKYPYAVYLSDKIFDI